MLKTELRSIYSQLCQDDMPMVRRAAATNLGKFAATVEPAHLKTDIMSMFEDLTQDGNLVFLIVSSCSWLAKDVIYFMIKASSLVLPCKS